MALTSLGMTARSVGAYRRRRRFVRSARSAAQLLFQKPGFIAVEQMTQQPAIKVGCSEQPVGDREGQIHVDLHHEARIVMGSMVTPQSVDEGTIAHEPVFLDMAAEVHELVYEIHACRHAHEKPTDVWRKDDAENRRHGQ